MPNISQPLKLDYLNDRQKTYSYSLYTEEKYYVYNILKENMSSKVPLRMHLISLPGLWQAKVTPLRIAGDFTSLLCTWDVTFHFGYPYYTIRRGRPMVADPPHVNSTNDTDTNPVC